MRAIIIEDKDSRALLDKLALVNFQISKNYFHVLDPNISEELIKNISEQIHGKFHYEVCVWLQDQGCNIIR